MLRSQATVWMPTIHCDSCGAEIPTENAIPYAEEDARFGSTIYNLYFFCSTRCCSLGRNLGVIEFQASKN